MTHLSPDANRVPDVIFTVGKLPDAVVDGDTALPGGKVLLCHLYPAQRTHGETLEGKGRRQNRDSWAGVTLYHVTKNHTVAAGSAQAPLFASLWLTTQLRKRSTVGRQKCDDLYFCYFEKHRDDLPCLINVVLSDIFFP